MFAARWSPSTRRERQSASEFFLSPFTGSPKPLGLRTELLPASARNWFVIVAESSVFLDPNNLASFSFFFFFTLLTSSVELFSQDTFPTSSCPHSSFAPHLNSSGYSFFSSILNRVLVCVSAWWREGLLAFFKLFTGRDVASPHTERTPCAIKGSKGTVYRGCNARKPLFHHWIVEQQRQIEAIFTGILNGATGGNTLESLPSSLPLSLRPPSSLSLSPTHTNTHSLCSKGLYLKRHLKLTLTLRTECYFLRRF